MVKEGIRIGRSHTKSVEFDFFEHSYKPIKHDWCITLFKLNFIHRDKEVWKIMFLLLYTFHRPNQEHNQR